LAWLSRVRIDLVGVGLTRHLDLLEVAVVDVDDRRELVQDVATDVGGTPRRGLGRLVVGRERGAGLAARGGWLLVRHVSTPFTAWVLASAPLATIEKWATSPVRTSRCCR